MFKGGKNENIGREEINRHAHVGKWKKKLKLFSRICMLIVLPFCAFC